MRRRTHHRLPWLLSLALLSLVAVSPQRSEAQLAVAEVGAQLVQTTNTSVQVTIHTAQWLLNLLGLPAFALEAGNFMEAMATLKTIVEDGSALAWDLASLQAQINSLFALETAPATSYELAQRMAEIRMVVFLTYNYAMRTQTLMSTVLGTIEDTLTLVNDLMAIVGVVQGTQTISQYQAKLVQLNAELKVQTTAFQRAKSVEAMSDTLAAESIQRITDTMMEDHPRF